MSLTLNGDLESNLDMLSDALVLSKRNIFDAFLQLNDILEISPSLGC